MFLVLKELWMVLRLPPAGTLSIPLDESSSMPFYFSFLTVMAIKVFLAEKVDVAIIEVGIGGENDATNMFRHTPVVGISSLGLDHMKLLGDTVEKIAWQKAGIMKKGSISITAHNQPPSALKVLYERANEKQCKLFEAPPFEKYEWSHKLGDLNLSGTIHEINASLGLQLAYAWLAKCKKRGSLDIIGRSFKLETDFFSGIKDCFWPGRQQIITRRNGDFRYYIDGAHTIESMNECSNWFNGQVKGSNATRILLFNVTSYRDTVSLMKPLISCHFDVAIFCCTIPSPGLSASSDQAILKTSEEHQLQKCLENEKLWIKLSHENCEVKEKITKTFKHVQDSVEFIKNLSGNNHILVTGSLYLVGALFSVLGPDLILTKNNKINKLS
ncbi:folylpolyglutamate synthase, mitochondrial-like isoform X1 [Lycorma delicatula]|uniref:folylpolyglutamate synthase, mitochondrial-like isoform X1 n=1 Tax=Lycorma delicatula TaxID=130591 RepID=UPI003F50F613